MLLPGTLCKAIFEGLTYTEDGFATVGKNDNKKGFRVFSQIDTFSYPSCNDFKGSTTVVYENDLVVIMGYVGRPVNVNHDPAWFMYDIYEVLVNGSRRQMFRQNISQIQALIDRH